MRQVSSFPRRRAARSWLAVSCAALWALPSCQTESDGARAAATPANGNTETDPAALVPAAAPPAPPDTSATPPPVPADTAPAPEPREASPSAETSPNPELAAPPAIAGGGSAPPPGTAPASSSAGPITLYLAGDSTVQTYPDTNGARDQAGWGQMLAPLLPPDVSVENRAIGGRTARRFIDEGRLDEILSTILSGDYLLIQFGTNDGNRTATYEIGDEVIPYYLDPATDFKAYLQQYLDGARERGAVPVLVTPPPRNSAYCTGGNGTGAHAQAMRELGRAQNVSVVDLNAASVSYLMAICPAPSPEDFFLLRGDGSVDGTHFQENGARILAGFVAQGLREVEPALNRRSE